MPPAALAAGAIGASALGGIYGAHEQSQANAANLAAQQANQEYLRNMAGGLFQSGPNQYAQMFQQFAQGLQPSAFTFNPTMATAPGQVQAGQLGAVPGFAGVGVGAPTIGEGFNTGQDALLQMLRTGFGGGVAGTGFQKNLEDLYSGASFDPNGVLSTLKPIDERMIEEQASALRGSTGSLGQRFGTDALINERQLRENSIQNIGARNASLLQQLSESAQNRRLQALGIGAQREQALGQLQLGAAGSLQQGGLDVARLMQAAQLATAQNQQQAGLQTQQFGFQGQQFNIAQALQAALANQGMLGQFSLANAGAMNQAGQFNAAQQQQAGQFNTQSYLQSLAQAQQAQQAQQQLNAQIFGVLGGVGVPQQQPGGYGAAIGSAAQYALLPWLLKMTQGRTPAPTYGGGGTYGGGWGGYGP